MRERLIELYQENIEGHGVPVLSAVIAAVAAALSWLEWLGELAAGLVMAGAMVVGCAAVMLDAALVLGGWKRGAAIALTLLTAGVTAAPILATVMPGEPLARGALQTRGDSIRLPDTVQGPVRLLIHGTLGGAISEIDYQLRGTEKPVKGSLKRSSSQQRVGRGGSTPVVQERNTEFLAASFPAAGAKLTLHDLNGQVSGALDVVVFHDSWPAAVDAPALTLLLVLITLLVARGGASPNLINAAALALFFGFFVYQFASPASAVRPQIGALILALIVGGAVGSALAWVAKKLAPQSAH